MFSATLIGPDKVQSVVQISSGSTVRDVATSRYHLFRRTTKRNGIVVDPFTTDVANGDTIAVESA